MGIVAITNPDLTDPPPVDVTLLFVIPLALFVAFVIGSALLRRYRGW